MFTSFFWPRGRRTLRFWEDGMWRVLLKSYGGLLLLCALVGAQVWVAYWFNEFQGRLGSVAENNYSTAQAMVSAAWGAVLLLTYIAAVETFLNPVANKVGRQYAVWWRFSMTDHFHAMLGRINRPIEGASQRLQEDCQMFAKLGESLAIEGVRSVLKIVVFIPILWTISQTVKIGPLGMFSGSLVWIIVGISVVGFGISYIISRSLKSLEVARQVEEAAFRRHLVHEVDDLALDAEEARRYVELRIRTESANNRLIAGLMPVEMFLEAFVKGMMLLAVVIGVQNFAAGLIVAGLMFQLIHAFGEVQLGFNFLMQRWRDVIELWSCIVRLRGFDEALIEAIRIEGKKGLVLPSMRTRAT